MSSPTLTLFWPRRSTAQPWPARPRTTAWRCARPSRSRGGDWQTAERLARESHAAIDATHLRDVATAIHVHAVTARVAIHRGDIARGREELVHAQLVRPLASYAMPWTAVGALIELARAYLAIADTAGARTAVAEAEAVLRRRPDLGLFTERVGELRRQVDEAASSLAGPSTLTAAELRVLPLLSTHLTFQEIADRLSNSRSTIHSHAVSIYAKLEVSGRSEAVERAIELGLLEPFPGPQAHGAEPARPGLTARSRSRLIWSMRRAQDGRIVLRRASVTTGDRTHRATPPGTHERDRPWSPNESPPPSR